MTQPTTEPNNRSQSPRKLVLASASPRRKELLEAARLSFEVMPASVDESQFENEPAEEFVRRIAAAKAEAVLLRLPTDSNAVVLGADTVVVVDSSTLGKPASAEDARRMLRLLSGRQHRVLTGVCVMHYADAGQSKDVADGRGIDGQVIDGRVIDGRVMDGRVMRKDVQICSTAVWFSPLSDAEINEYVGTGEPFDKAGAYAIQGRASKFVGRIDGCYFNVVGLPVSLIYRMLAAFEIPATVKK